MAKINITLNNKNYEIDESSISAAFATLKSHLSTVMNGTGAIINLGDTTYSVDSTKLSDATNDFVTHLGKISGTGHKVVVGGVEYSVDSTKISDALSAFEGVLGDLGSGGDASIVCPNCNGTGHYGHLSGEAAECSVCRGTGKEACPTCGGDSMVGAAPCPDCYPDHPGTTSHDCSACNGTGFSLCNYCGGTGYMDEVAPTGSCPTCGGSGKVCVLCGGADVDEHNDCSVCTPQGAPGTGKVCPDCRGTGNELAPGLCVNCQGTGKICFMCGGIIGENELCISCHSSMPDDCPVCGGTGKA